jgi:hypothetical protein
MKTNIAILIIVSISFFGFFIQKGKYFTSNGKITFYSSAPIENIEALNSKVTSLLDTDNGDIVFSMLIKDFVFEKSLMQEHFNENYMESDKYPKATFKGRIANLADVKFEENGKYNATIQGDLTIHNVTKKISVNGTIETKEGKIFAKAKFPIRVKDYNIDIPKLVFQNIAEVVEVTVDMVYQPYTK